MKRLTLAIALVVAMAVPAADASFPGRNGRLVFVSDRAASPSACSGPEAWRGKTSSRTGSRFHDGHRACCRYAAEGVAVSRGVFGARLEVALVNDGPVTIVLEA
jgi:D-Tyr-tRNAtyr deacylase